MSGRRGGMGGRKRILVSWILHPMVLLFVVHGSRGLDVSPSPSILPPLPHLNDRAPIPGSSPVLSPAPHEVMSPSNTALAPLVSPPGSSSLISPAPHEAKSPSSATPLPWTTHPIPSPLISPSQDPNASTILPAPVMSPMSSTPSTSPSPPSNNGPSPWTSHSIPSPVISPVPRDVKSPSNSSPSPLISAAPQAKNPSIITPAPLMPHKDSPPLTRPPNEANTPNNAPAPWTSHTIPPTISPVPRDEKNPSNTSLPPMPLNPVSSPVVRPAPHEIKNPSNTTLGPLTPHEVKNASSPSASPSTSFPAISPVPHQTKNPSNIPPSPSTPYPTNISPEPHVVKNHSNTTHAPLTSEPGSSPVASPEPHGAQHPHKGHNITYAPMASHPQPPSTSFHSSASSPTTSVLPPSSVEGPAISESPLHPPELSGNRQRHRAPSVNVQDPSLSPIQAPYSSDRDGAPSPSPLSVIPSRRHEWPVHSPILPPSGSSTRKPIAVLPPIWAPPSSSRPIHSPIQSPSGSLSRKPRAPTPQPVWRLPSPPPNFDCHSLQCSEPLASSPPGSPCACVLPIRVKLRLGVALYTFFPLVSELAQEIADGIFTKQSQVRIMGANADIDPEKTIVIIDLVPLGKYFDNTTAFLMYQKFWHKQVAIAASFFGDYDVLYVLYPGLPPTPPSAPSYINVDNGAYGNGNNGRTIHPFGVDVGERKEKASGSLIAIIVLSCVIALLFVIGVAWLLILKQRNRAHLSSSDPPTLLPTFAKTSGTGPTILASKPSSASASFSSSIPTYTGSAKSFSLDEIERATSRFDDSRVIGEGGFGRVYEGTLEDGTRVAVKVLKRDDQQGGREFFAEVEMLGRLHHRNLVKLIGICTEEIRCLVYELIPNGSVDSHLHGADKEIAPLDWSARVKIALGAARALAYLHEDSSPRVIHRDFKSSNILLEHDFTPKVSDFGLARAAMDGGNDHISTRVMGTFGYVAPEYAMTGHLLVKSDVYSYGVVLLELLTGRKPVDMLQPSGQENLVTWARPLLTSLDGLDTIIDPALGPNVHSDSVAKVAAIASMCVQPEVSHRPFMGEVVQALKLVCNEDDEYRLSGSFSPEELPALDRAIEISVRMDLEEERGLSPFDVFSTSARFTRDASGSFRRCSSSGPLEGSRSRQFQRVRGSSTGSMSEHGVALKYVTGSESHEQWP